MGAIGVITFIFAFTWLMVRLLKKLFRIRKLINEIQGPTELPLIGNVHQFRFNPDEFFEQAQGLAYMFNEHPQRICRIWIGPLPIVLLYGAEECEAVLGSSKILTKLFQYNFLSPWIGDGLLISKPNKWKQRRKLLTPTFHYDILKDFVEIFNKHSKTLISVFDKLANKNDYCDVFHKITLCTLDIICESSLGVCINAQQVHTDYLEAVFIMKYIIHQRQIKPQYYPEILFNIFGEGKTQKRCVEILHKFTKNAIEERRKKANAVGGIKKLLEIQRKNLENGKHSKMALLDLLLDMQDKQQLDANGVQEEVDTFVFEGHDTTSAALNWFLHLMGVHLTIQARVQREIDDILGSDLDREITFDDLGNLKYLDACLKETLRLYPSVPLIARQVTEETNICGFVLPVGTGVVILPSMVHRDERFWNNPELFDPERFLGNYLKHPYCYIPFSAGSRNCIGQRFALMEEKCLIANILRQFSVESKLRTEHMRVSAELIIRPLYGNKIRLTKRKFGNYIVSK